MAKQVTIDLYTIEELSPEARKRAIEKLHDTNVDSDGWWDGIYEDADQVASLMGIDIARRMIRKRDGSKVPGGPDIQFSGFASQGDGCSFTGSYSHKPDAPQAVREHAPLDEELHAIADDLEKLQQEAGGGLIATITRDRTGIAAHYVHERTVTTNLQDDEDGKWTEARENALGEIMIRFMKWIYSQLENEYMYQTSDEAIVETIEANDWYFTADGTLHG